MSNVEYDKLYLLSGKGLLYRFYLIIIFSTPEIKDKSIIFIALHNLQQFCLENLRQRKYIIGTLNLKLTEYFLSTQQPRNCIGNGL